VQTKNAAEDAVQSLDDANKFAANLKVMCNDKAGEMEERVKTRQEEVVAIGEAISVLNNDDALDVFKESLGKKEQGSFLQTRHAKGSALAKARDMITSTIAKSKNNAPLSLLAHAVAGKIKSLEKAGTKVDFSKVIKMVDDMVALLKKEQADDEKHKTYCEGEFDTSDDEKKETTRKLESLTSAISEMKDEIAAVSEEIKSLNAENVELDKAVAEATEQRKEEHSDYTEKVQLNEAAIQLIFKAKNRLQKFYNPGMHVKPKEREMTREEELAVAAGGEKPDLTQPPVFVQVRKHQQSPTSELNPGEAPETFEGDYKAKGQKSNSIMALMDMLTKDLEKEITEAEHMEKTAQKEYTELVADAQETRAQNVKSITDKEASKANVEGKLEEAKTSHIVTADQLEQIKNYIADLHQSCDFIMAQFEFRRESRTQERESLENAKAVLSGASYGL
jgi:regulator of replication initiation timing